MVRTPIVIAVTGALRCDSSLFTGRYQRDPLWWAPELFRFGFQQPLTPQNRVELARLSEAYCREVLDAVPTNTPAEETWVMTEYKSVNADTDRLLRLTSSKEWARHRLKETASECLEKVALLQQAQAQKRTVGRSGAIR